jgi:ubiquinone biosynthesis protein
MAVNRISLKRIWQIRSVARRYGLAEYLDELNLSKSARLGIRLLIGSGKIKSDLSRGERLRSALTELGPVFVKLGQALSTRPDLLAADIALELTKLQDQVPPFAGEEALQIIKAQFGEDFEKIFESVEQEPMASASVAQVHAAKLKKDKTQKGKNGKASQDVIIKVLRPGIEQIINSDLQAMYFIAGLLQKHWSQGKLLKPVDVIREYDTTIHDELDLRREAANCGQMAHNFENSDLIYVPLVYWDYTNKDVMVMERIYGTPIREIDTLKAKGIDLQALAHKGVEVFFKQAFEDNFFHADMHPGNIFVSDEGNWIAVDFGIMGSLSDKDKQYLSENLLAFFRRDYKAVTKAYIRAGWVPADTRLEEFETAIRTVCEPNFARPISEISFGDVLVQLFQTARRFNMPVQPQLVLLYKTLLNIEGLGRQLYPQLNLWDTAQPFLERYIKKQMSPINVIKEFKNDFPLWLNVAKSLPDLVVQGIEKANQANVIEQEQEKSRDAKSARQQFHMIFGFGLAGVSLLAYFLDKTGQLANHSLLAQYSPISLGVGLVWAYLASKSRT